ncbi:50S ribosomal protein L3 N(5)-glutamine methyltransferase [Nevskia sp.]|uniref:50S ribosomal protein L3 N(5)-glutamine methyltransferase n=1 Tax=Nevskia sp. TaxID=1929292 RepID=UPI0025E02D58|nr:50S ribosomal protein L3 N(5)-glutamine methyltransferase [Nevskia sp.]
MSDTPDVLAPLRTVRDLIRWGASEFNRQGLVFGHGTDNALDEAFHLVLSTLKLPFDLPAAYLATHLADYERAAVIAVLRERVASRKPAPYLTGIAYFCGLEFEVNEKTLVPRSPIGEMIESGFQPWLPSEPATILDLCSGSGCIGIASAFAFPQATVDLAEIDDGAAAVLVRNIARHHLNERVRPVIGDLFGPVGSRRYDLIVSNPPYVPTAEWAALAPEFQHEPKRALEAGADGMDIVERILREAPAHLSDDGVLICEIGGSDDEFEARFPGIPVAWPEFEKGGDGVFVITRRDLNDWLRARSRRK